MTFTVEHEGMGKPRKGDAKNAMTMVAPSKGPKGKTPGMGGAAAKGHKVAGKNPYPV